MDLILSTIIYVLMVLPTAILIKAHNITFTRHFFLVLLVLVVELLCSTVAAGVAPSAQSGSETVETVALAIAGRCFVAVTEVLFIQFVLNNPVARRSFHLDEAADPCATVAVIWTVWEIVLFRWMLWYRHMGGKGFEPASLITAVESFLRLLLLLGVGRRVRERGSSALIYVLLAVIIGAAASAVNPPSLNLLSWMPLLISVAAVSGVGALIFPAVSSEDTAPKQKTE